jgi:hypothetical protein
MNLYVVYYIGDYAHPVAISKNREQAERYAYKINKQAKWSQAYVKCITLDNEIVELDCE